MIGNIQALRAFAALGVVFYHTRFLPFGGRTDFYGVPTFFVISGFIMCFVTQRDPSRFVEKRLVRIVPLYWLCLLFCVKYFQPGQYGWLFDSAFFVPTHRPPMLGVGWTLNFEMFFYALFAVSLAINARLAPILTTAVLLSIFAISAIFDGPFLVIHYSHEYVQCFVAGIALYYVWKNAPRLPYAGWIAGAGIGTIYLSILFLRELQTYDYGYLVFPIFIVGLALLANCNDADLRWKPIMLLGDASYAIYLVHAIVIEEAARWGLPRDWRSSSVWAALITVAVCTAIGVAVHLWIERPLGKVIKLCLQFFRTSREDRAAAQA